mgnify:CR=1 FL=1
MEIAATGYGVVPVENSTEGAIGRTLDLLLATPARVCGEIMLPVQQCLMSKAKNLKAVKKVYSHAQSLGQCQRWLARNLPGVEQQAVVSNAEAAVLAARDPKAAALASRTALFRRIQAAVKDGQKTVLTEMLGPELTDMRSGDLRKALRRGDKFVERVVAVGAPHGIHARDRHDGHRHGAAGLGGATAVALRDEVEHLVGSGCRRPCGLPAARPAAEHAAAHALVGGAERADHHDRQEPHEHLG